MSIKEIITNGLIKALLIIKHKHFGKMTWIKAKKELLTFIKQENNLKDTFQ